MSCTCLVSHDDLAWQLHKASSIKRRSTRRLVEKQFVVVCLDGKKIMHNFRETKCTNKNATRRDGGCSWKTNRNSLHMQQVTRHTNTHAHTPTHTPTHIGSINTPTQTRAERAVGTITMTMTTTMTIHQYAYCDDIVRVVRIASHRIKRKAITKN